jgi:hypothetical protein
LHRNSDGERVEAAVLWYLLVLVGLNLYVWIPWIRSVHVVHGFPLGDEVERFGDLLRFSGKYQIGKDPRILDTEHLIGILFPPNYFPFAAVIFVFLLQVCAPYALPVFLVVVLGAVGLASTLLWRNVRRFEAYRWYVGAAIFATGLFGWATEQVAMRANIEGVMWIGMWLGAALYARRSYRGAAVAFGLACCIKPFPVLWLGLMARHQRYREVGLGMLSAVAVTLASLLVVPYNPLRAYGPSGGKNNFFSDYVVGFRPITGDHSLFQTMKIIGRLVHDNGQFLAIETGVRPNDPVAMRLYPIYLALAAAISLGTLWMVWNKPVLNQIFALACVTTVLPSVSGDYTLSVLLIPMGFFLIFLLQDVAAGRVPMSLGAMLWFLLPCAWIMAPEPLILIHSVMKCFAILILLGASVAIPLPSTVFDETAA